MDNVIKFYPLGAAKDPDNVLEHAIGEYDKIIILGYGKDDEMDVRASTNFTEGDILWIIERFKHKLMALDYNEEEE